MNRHTLLRAAAIATDRGSHHDDRRVRRHRIIGIGVR